MYIGDYNLSLPFPNRLNFNLQLPGCARPAKVFHAKINGWFVHLQFLPPPLPSAAHLSKSDSSHMHSSPNQGNE